jgi:hypothetical protein
MRSVVQSAECSGVSPVSGVGAIGVGALLQQELCQAPVAVEASTIEAEIVAERAKGCAVGEQVADGADIAVVGAMFHERDAVVVSRGGGVAGGEVVEYQIVRPLAIRSSRGAVSACMGGLRELFVPGRRSWSHRGRGMGWKRKMWATGGLP